MGLDALHVTGELRVELELVKVLAFVLMGPGFAVALDRLSRLSRLSFSFFLQC